MNNKINVICACPCQVKSGYGYRSRDFLHALYDLKREEWNIKVISNRWGDNTFGLLDGNDPRDKEILDNIQYPQEALSKQPDGFILISVPNESPQQKIGKYFNWVITAGVETDIFPAELIQGCNRTDLTIFSSNFSKEVAEKTSFDQLDERTKSKIGELKLNVKSEVLLEGVNTEVFKKSNVQKEFDLSEIKEDFCFLSVAQWLNGTTELEDRKNLGALIKTFLYTFKDQKNTPGLILKTSTAGYSISSKEFILNEIDKIRKEVFFKESLPNIYLLHGSLEDSELNALYNNDKVKCMITIGSEGFGRPALEFSCASYKPIIASPYSGHVDYLLEKNNLFVGGELKRVPQQYQNQFFIDGSSLFKVNPNELSMCLQDILVNYKKYLKLSNEQGKHSRENFSFENMKYKLQEIIYNNVPNIPKPIQLKLPSLKK